MKNTSLLLSVATVVVSAMLATPALAQEQHEHAASTGRLGTVHFETSCSPEVTKDFDRGVALLHSFWFDQAIATFTDVARRDPTCGVSQWGVALAMWGNVLGAGPQPEGITKALAAVEKGRQMGTKTERERHYLEAVSAFYAGAPGADARARKLAYEAAMERLAAAYPRDSEATIFSAMALTGAQLPTEKTYAKLLKAADLLEPLFKTMPDHPGLAHYIIHAYDVPALASRALEAARSYASIAPDAPHALHMPSHTFTRLGYWDESVRSNTASAASARRAKSLGDELHAYDYLVYAYLQTARDAESRQVIETAFSVGQGATASGLGQGNLPAAPGGGVGAYALAAMPARYALERGRWAEAAQLKERPGASPAVRAMTLFARGLGLARGEGGAAPARAELAGLAAIHEQLAGANQSFDAEQVDIQRRSVEAWILYAEGKKDEAVALMQAAAAMQDKTEKSAISPGPIAPARELYAEMLLELGRHAEALAAFEASARQEPSRFRGVYGAAKAARLMGNTEKARTYYAELVRISEKGDATARPELTEARAHGGR